MVVVVWVRVIKAANRYIFYCWYGHDSDGFEALLDGVCCLGEIKDFTEYLLVELQCLSTLCGMSSGPAAFMGFTPQSTLLTSSVLTVSTASWLCFYSLCAFVRFVAWKGPHVFGDSKIIDTVLNVK